MGCSCYGPEWEINTWKWSHWHPMIGTMMMKPSILGHPMSNMFKQIQLLRASMQDPPQRLGAIVIFWNGNLMAGLWWSTSGLPCTRLTTSTSEDDDNIKPRSRTSIMKYHDPSRRPSCSTMNIYELPWTITTSIITHSRLDCWPRRLPAAQRAGVLRQIWTSLRDELWKSPPHGAALAAEALKNKGPRATPNTTTGRLITDFDPGRKCTKN